MSMKDWMRNVFGTRTARHPAADRLARPRAARADPGDTLYLDTETTGLGADARIVELALVDDGGHAVLDTLVDPLVEIPAGATAIHGIGDDDVAGMPTIEELLPRLDAAIGGRRVVIYNASYDQRLFPCRLRAAGSVHCAMRRFKQLSVASGHGNGTLARAAAWAGHRWSGAAHRALADALATRIVWRALENRGVPLAEGSRRLRA